MPPSLAEQIAQFKVNAAGMLDPSSRHAYESEQAALAAAGPPQPLIAIGDTLPGVSLLDAHGGPTTLAAAQDSHRAVLVFYRGGWCPYCNLTLRAYQQQLLRDLDSRGTRLIAISPQTPDGSLSTQETDDLAFAVLSDPGNQLARAVGILTAPTEQARAAQLAGGLDIAERNVDGRAEIPMPTVVILEADGTVAWIDVHADYTQRTEPGTILDALDAVTESARTPEPARSR